MSEHHEKKRVASENYSNINEYHSNLTAEENDTLGKINNILAKEDISVWQKRLVASVDFGKKMEQDGFVPSDYILWYRLIGDTPKDNIEKFDTPNQDIENFIKSFSK